MKWVRDEVFESMLKANGYEFAYDPKYHLPNIDFELSKEEQSRLGRKLDDDKVIEFAEAMKLPESTFKAIGLNVVDRRPVRVFHGLHRTASALLAELPHVGAYILRLTKPLDLELLPRMVNIWDDKVPISKEVKLAYAADMIVNHSMQLAEACKKFRLTYDSLNKYMLQNKTAEQISAGGVKSENISRQLLTKLAGLRHDKRVLVETSRLISDHKMPNADAEQLVLQVKKEETQAEKLAIVEKWNRKLTKSTVKPKAPMAQPVRKRVLDLMGSLHLLFESYTTKEQLQLHDEDIPEFVDHAVAINQATTKIIQEGKAKKNGK